MNKGFSVVLGMSLAYGVSFFGLLLAWIVYQRNNHKDELWRRRSIGISFFGTVYGYVLPLIIVMNALITVAIKLVKGWDYNILVWNNTALFCTVAGILMFYFLGLKLWRLQFSGYLAAVVVAAAGMVACFVATVGVTVGVLEDISSLHSVLHEIGAYVTGFIWHLLWVYYLMKGQVRRAFSGAPAQA